MRPVIYADHAATTALSVKAKEAMEPYRDLEYANPSTLYSMARNPRKAVREARERIASAIGAKAEEIYFTSCGTESDNWALKGIAFRYPEKKCRILTSAIEHHAVLNTCAFLERMGYPVRYLPVDEKGILSPEVLESEMTEDTALVSVMTANNEIGTVEPVAGLAQAAHRGNALFHTDAVQAIGHIPVRVDELGVDLLSASAHKFNGPKGVGFLYARGGTVLEPLLHGGGQETRMRSGTENVAGIAGMAAALTEHMERMREEGERLEGLRARLIEALRQTDIDFRVNGAENHIPGNLSLSIRGLEGEAVLHRLDLMGIAIATGSACNSKDTVLSHVIQAIRVPDEYASGTVRITLGMDNDEEQVDRIAAALQKVARRTPE